MKAIINGKRFDTEKAILIGEGSHGYGGDFSAWHASLYRTPRSGAYFLAGHGGPMTRWARSLGDNNNGRTGGSGIIPLDREEALEWAEAHLTAEQVEGAFGDLIEDA
jgi:hypothetical protein